jgi:hypothetical protein
MTEVIASRTLEINALRPFETSNAVYPEQQSLILQEPNPLPHGH